MYAAVFSTAKQISGCLSCCIFVGMASAHLVLTFHLYLMVCCLYRNIHKSTYSLASVKLLHCSMYHVLSYPAWRLSCHLQSCLRLQLLWPAFLSPAAAVSPDKSASAPATAIPSHNHHPQPSSSSQLLLLICGPPVSLCVF